MTFRDRWETDEAGKQFVFTVEMQRALQDAGLPIEPSALVQIREQFEAKQASQSSGGRSQSRHNRPEKKPRRDDLEPDSIQVDAVSGKFLGRIKTFRHDRGYGFIMRGGGEQIFFHRSNSLEDPDGYERGQWVLYDVQETDRGDEAVNVESYVE